MCVFSKESVACVLFTAHFTHYFHIAHIVLIQTPQADAGLRKNGEEMRGWHKACIARTHKHSVNQNAGVSVGLLTCAVMRKLFTGTWSGWAHSVCGLCTEFLDSGKGVLVHCHSLWRVLVECYHLSMGMYIMIKLKASSPQKYCLKSLNSRVHRFRIMASHFTLRPEYLKLNLWLLFQVQTTC